MVRIYVFCPKYGNKIEGVVLNRVRILGIFWPKQGQNSPPTWSEHLATYNQKRYLHLTWPSPSH